MTIKTMQDAVNDFLYFEQKNKTIVVLTSSGHHMQLVCDTISKEIKLPRPYVLGFNKQNRSFDFTLKGLELKILIRRVDNIQDLLGFQLDLIVVSGFGYTATQIDKLNQFLRQNKRIKVKFFDEILF